MLLEGYCRNIQTHTPLTDCSTGPLKSAAIMRGRRIASLQPVASHGCAKRGYNNDILDFITHVCVHAGIDQTCIRNTPLYRRQAHSITYWGQPSISTLHIPPHALIDRSLTWNTIQYNILLNCTSQMAGCLVKWTSND